MSRSVRTPEQHGTRIIPVFLTLFLTWQTLTVCPATVCSAATAGDFEIDLKELDKLRSSSKKSPVTPRKSSVAKQAKTISAQQLKGTAHYTVKPGDNLFKILIRDFGLSNNEAEQRIPEIIRLNGLSGSQRLQIGKTLTIPAERQHKPAARHPRRTPEIPGAPHSETTPPPQEQLDDKPATVEAPVTVEAAETAKKPFMSVHSISGSDTDQIVDMLLSALSLPWEKDKVIAGNAGSGSPESFSIKVQRYLELDSKRYVLSGTTITPYEYTMFRLLEMAGYNVLRLEDREGFNELAEQLFRQLGFSYTAGRHCFTVADKTADKIIIEGYMVSLKKPGVTVFITEKPLDAINAGILESSVGEPCRNSSGKTVEQSAN